ncbi:hypothetical protein ACFL6I_11420 [candidate division KSB1 bacterium]
MGINTPSSKDELLEEEVSPEMKEALEMFEEDMEDASELAVEMGFSTPLQSEGLPSLETLGTFMGKEEILEMLMQKFGVNPEGEPVKQYPMGGEPGEGAVEVKVFATNVPDVFLGQYIDAEGGSDWTIRPLELEEFE